MPRHPDAGRSSVHEEHRVVSRQLAQGRSQELGTYRLYARSFGDVVLQEFMERGGFRDVPFEKGAISLLPDFRQQRGNGAFDIADQRQINCGAAPDVLRVLIDLDLLNFVAGKKFRKRKVGAEHQQQIGFVNRLVCSAVAEQPGHPDGIGIVMLEPLLAAKRKSDRSLQHGRELQYLGARIAASVAAENRHLVRVFDHPGQLVEIRIGRAHHGQSGDREGVSRMVRHLGCCDVAAHRDQRRPFVDNGRHNRGRDHGPHLFRVDHTPDVETRGVEKFVRVQLFERGGVDQLGLDVAGDRDDRGALFARVHQSVEEMRHAGSGRSANCHRFAAQVGIGDRGEDPVLLVTNMDELDLAVAPERVDHWIQRISDNSVAAFYAGLRQHLPHYIRNSTVHRFSS